MIKMTQKEVDKLFSKNLQRPHSLPAKIKSTKIRTEFVGPANIKKAEPGKQVINGSVPSKSNLYIPHGGGMNKSKALQAYEKNFFIQCNKYRDAYIDGYFEFYIDLFCASQRSDLDGCMKIILDCLQRIRAIKNDNRCVKIVASKFLDKQNPRIEFELKEVNI